MKDFWKEHGILVLFIGAVIAVLLVILSLISVNSSPLVNLVRTITSPVRAVSTGISDWVENKQNYFRDVTELQEENARLKAQIAEMEETYREAQSDREENAMLRKLLRLRDQRRDLSDFETAKITEVTSTNWESSFTLNKGTAHGIQEGNCVIDDTGALVGQVVEAGLNWCRVLTIVDTDTSLGARIFRTQDLCVASGNFAYMEEGRLLLSYLPADSSLLVGDLVQTSGFGGYLPTDLVIGFIEDLQMDDTGMTSVAVVRPACDFSSLSEVCVIKSFEIVD